MATKPLTVHGVDISHHQGGSIDFAGAAKRGLQWVYHKATEGSSFVDKNYDRRRQEAKKAGIPFGAYHFARAEGGDARKEAQHFLRIAKPQPGDLAPCLDIETDEGLSMTDLRRWVATFVAEVSKAVGVKPVIYTPFDLGAADDGCIIWRPRYNNSNTPPLLKWDIWQFSNGVYGVPNTLAGFGHVDLNVMRKGLEVKDFQIPKAKPTRPVTRLHIMHCSMQFSDPTKAQAADARKIFDRAADRGVAWLTGTEAGAGAGALRSLLKEQAVAHDYRFWMDPQTDSWYAVQKALIAGGWDTWSGPVIIPGKAKRNTAKKATSVQFDTEDLGTIGVLGAHYMTKGRPNATSPEYRQFVKENRALATAVGERAVILGKGQAIAFYGGDQNIVDRTEDTFFGQPLTSAWDELGKYENTGHGNIDVIASYDRDGRVEAAYCRALDDKEFSLHTDHFLVEAGYDVKHVR